MIPKSEMINGRWYSGFCRNTRVALWDKKEDKFIHLRFKFGYRMDKIEHFEDVQKDRLDGFVPIELIEQIHHEKIWKVKDEIGY